MNFSTMTARRIEARAVSRRPGPPLNFLRSAVKIDDSFVTCYLTINGLATYTIEGSKKGVGGAF